jgi:hypothetical protein
MLFTNVVFGHQWLTIMFFSCATLICTIMNTENSCLLLFKISFIIHFGFAKNDIE